jgi:Dna[CI] antecedent DciA-like protein
MKRVPQYQVELATLKRLSRVKQQSGAARPPQPLGPVLLEFHQRSVQKRQPKIQRLCDAWLAVVPHSLCQHCSLESFARGKLTVLVDSQPHLYQLKQLLLAGLEGQLITDCRGSGLRKVSLKRGQWYAGDNTAAVRF